MQLQNRFLTHDIEAIFKFGLHDFLQKMISLFADLSEQIEIDYRFYEWRTWTLLIKQNTHLRQGQ